MNDFDSFSKWPSYAQYLMENNSTSLRLPLYFGTGTPSSSACLPCLALPPVKTFPGLPLIALILLEGR
jgi:hypothetical protein